MQILLSRQLDVKDVGIRNEPLNQEPRPERPLRRTSHDEFGGVIAHGIADRLVVSRLPLNPKPYFIAPASAQTVALDSIRTIVGPVAVDDSFVTQSKLAHRSVPGRDMWALLDQSPLATDPAPKSLDQA